MTAPREGWNVPSPDVIPRPTAWPPAMALGIALVGWGLITSGIIFGIGVIVFAVALVGWIQEMRHER